MTDTHARQEAGSPQGIGGQFKATAKSESPKGLTAVPGQEARNRAADAARSALLRSEEELEGPLRRLRKASLHAIDTTIAAAHPTATAANFVRLIGGNEWLLQSITDADGQPIEIDDDVMFRVNATIPRLGDDVATSMHGRISDGRGYGAYLNVGTTEPVGFEDMAREEANKLVGPVLTRLGTVGGSWDLTEAQYRLDEGADTYGFDETTWPKMLAKYGDEDKALEAIWGTRAYQALDEDIPEYATVRFTERLTQAVEELDL